MILFGCYLTIGIIFIIFIPTYKNYIKKMLIQRNKLQNKHVINITTYFLCSVLWLYFIINQIIIPYFIDYKNYIYYSDILYEGQCVISSIDAYIPNNTKNYKLLRLNVYNYKHQKVVINTLINTEIINQIGKRPEIKNSNNYLYNLIVHQALELIDDKSTRIKVNDFFYSGVMDYLFEELNNLTELVHSKDIKRKFNLENNLEINYDSDLKKYFTLL